MSTRRVDDIHRACVVLVALVALLVTSASTGCGVQEESRAAREAPQQVDPLQGARDALEAKRWSEAVQQAELALEAGVETEAARALAEQARAEATNKARLGDAHALFVAEQYSRAYSKLLGFPSESVYSGQVANMLVRIRHAAVLPEAIERADRMPMRRIVIGSFPRGSDAAEAERAHRLCEKYTGRCQKRWFDREQPRRRIVTGSFYIDEREVSVAQYAECGRAGACPAIDWAACGVGDDTRGDFVREELPQVCVTWDDARAYCEHVGARLPSEAEWEHAASGPRAWRFPWGQAWNAHAANWADGDQRLDGYSGLAPVDAFAPGAWGLRQMAGNAYEWVADWYAEDFYASAAETNPRGPHEGVMRVIRGGAFNASPSSLRAAHRNRMIPDERSNNVGFRCAASPEQMPLAARR